MFTINLEDVVYFLGTIIQYASEKASHGGNRKCGQEKSSGQNDPLICERTSARIARENGVGEKTVRRAERFANGVDVADGILPGFREGVFDGTIKLKRQKDIEMLPLLEPHKRAEKLADMLSKTEKSKCPSNSKAAGTTADVSEDASSNAKALGYMIIEMTDALNTMTSRWDICISEHSKILTLPSTHSEVQKLIIQLNQYIDKIKEVFP